MIICAAQLGGSFLETEAIKDYYEQLATWSDSFECEDTKR